MLVLSPALTGKEIVDIICQTGTAAGVQFRKNLRRGQQQRLIEIFCAALAGDIKIAHGIQLVTPEFHANRRRGGGGVHIQNAATEGELSRALYQRAAAITQRSESLISAFSW